MTKADMEHLRDLIAAMEKSTAKTDVRAHLEQNAEFHELIVKRSGNGKLLETYRRLRTPNRSGSANPYITKYNTNP